MPFFMTPLRLYFVDADEISEQFSLIALLYIEAQS